MPAVTHTAVLDAPTDQVWSFVRSFDSWAAFIDGYQDHEVLNDTRSTWSIKGTAGSITRTVEFDVEITEWIEGVRVEFALTGCSEPLTGTGRFLTRTPEATASNDHTTTASAPAPKPRLAQLLDRLGRWLHARIFQGRDVAPARADAPPADGSSPVSGGARTELTFELELVAGGMTAPMINPMMVPMLTPVAENLANRLSDAITHQAPATKSVPDA